MYKNKERNLMTARSIFTKLPRSTLCSYHRSCHQDVQGLGTEQNESEATDEGEADSRINSVVLKQQFWFKLNRQVAGICGEKKT